MGKNIYCFLRISLYIIKSNKVFNKKGVLMQKSLYIMIFSVLLISTGSCFAQLAELKKQLGSLTDKLSILSASLKKLPVVTVQEPNTATEIKGLINQLDTISDENNKYQIALQIKNNISTLKASN